MLLQCSAVLLCNVRPHLEGMVGSQLNQRGMPGCRRLPTFSLFRTPRRRTRCRFVQYGGSRRCFFVREDIGWDGGQFFCFCACFGARLALASAVWFAFPFDLHLHVANHEGPGDARWLCGDGDRGAPYCSLCTTVQMLSAGGTTHLLTGSAGLLD